MGSSLSGTLLTRAFFSFSVRIGDRIMRVLQEFEAPSCPLGRPVALALPVTRDNAVTARNADEAEPTGYPIIAQAGMNNPSIT
jgi:hypothetical protein